MTRYWMLQLLSLLFLYHASPSQAQVDYGSFRQLMDANRWWFNVGHHTDGSFYYPPNGDNAGYGSDSHMVASAATAFTPTIPKRGLVMTGMEGRATSTQAEKPVTAPKPLKIFILAGQSNMQGHASVTTFDSMAADPKTAPLLQEMRDNDGLPKVCERVWISSIGCLGDAYSDLTEAKGKLTVGFGAPEDKIGPEFTFGLTMEKLLNEPVLIIKTSWGGRSLHTDFRPPSAGPFVLAKETQKLWDENPQGAHGIPKAEDRPKFYADKAADTGVYYREMIAHTKKVLEDIKRVVPDYDEKQGYELAGFVWFQGFNDYVDGGVYPKQDQAGGYDAYADLLGHFIRDVRKDLSAPHLPIVIGVMGIDGLRGDKNAPMMHFREAQRKPSTLDEFKGNVIAVETAPFWDDDLEKLSERMDNCWPKVDAKVVEEKKQNSDADSWENKMKLMAENFTKEEWQRLSGASNGGYHYLGAAKIIAPIGQAFAESLIGLQAAQEVAPPTRDGTLHLFSFGVGAAMEGPPVDDLYGRDAGFVVEALKRTPSAWKRVEPRFLSGLECTPERLRDELQRLSQEAKSGDLVFIHASTHGTTEDGLLRLDSERETIIDANVIAASLAELPCPALVTIDSCQAGGAVRSPLPKQSAWLLGCAETQSTSGQVDDPKVPHGFLVLAICEALRGDADLDRDGLVTIGELFKWVPARATDLARGQCEQDAVVVLPKDVADLPLTRTKPGPHKPLWTPK